MLIEQKNIYGQIIRLLHFNHGPIVWLKCEGLLALWQKISQPQSDFTSVSSLGERTA